MPNPSTQPTLYALLIGVNEYPDERRVNNLAGCINDVALVRSYLGQPHVMDQFGTNRVKIVELTNPVNDGTGGKDGRGATKDNIVAAIKEHLGQAQTGDTTLLFFAGHGIREFTDIIAFQEEEIDENIGGLVCTDFRFGGSPGPYILCDKELRYLIRQLAENEDGSPRAHVVTVFDCCHSGENTRSVLSGDLPPTSRQVQRYALDTPRPVEEYIFFQDPQVKSLMQENRPLRDILPLGEHIMLAACREVELAWEGGGKRNGAFTLALVDVLEKHQGNISYHDLQSRILNCMRFNIREGESLDRRQTPQFYIRSDNPAGRYNAFLTNKPTELTRDCNVVYNESDQEWRIDIGAFHGLPIDPKKTPTAVAVYPINTPSEKVKAKVSRTFPTYALIEFEEPFRHDETVAYRGIVEGLTVPPLKVFIGGVQQRVELAEKELTDRLKKVHTQLFELTGQEQSADYVLYAENDFYQIRLPFETRPLLKKVPFGTAGRAATTFDTLFENLHQMARWTFLRDLEYIPKAHLNAPAAKDHRMYPVELQVFEYDKESGTEKQIFPTGSKLTIQLTKESPESLLRFELVNHAREDLNVSLIYMPFNFGFSVEEGSRIMKEPQMLLGPGMKLDTLSFIKMENGKGYIPLVIEDYAKQFNLIGEENYLKLVVSKTPFDLSTFHLDPLPTADEEDTRSTRGFEMSKEEPELPEIDWEIRTFELFISNPDYVPES